MKSTNPYTGKEIETFEEIDNKQVDNKIKRAQKTFKSWRFEKFERRRELMFALAEELKNNKRNYAEDITKEVGKPISQAIAEVEKCAWVCEYYAEHAEEHLKKKYIDTDAKESYVSHEPLGPVLAVMPWNYPYWQAFRFAAPALMAGNVGLLKHASNVMRCAENIEKAIRNAGFPEGCFQNLLISSKKVDRILKNKRVKAVTLTGSKPAGSAVASTAGKQIKKSVLELGGSNALVVFEDADIEAAVKTCIQARFQNTGQSCIAGKRLIVHESIQDRFTEAFLSAARELKSGDPMEEDTFIGVMAREDLAKELEDQMNRSVKKGARIILGGKRKGTYFEPTILVNVHKKMSVFEEETFGPLIGITPFKTDMEAIDLVNRSQFGLGVSIFTQDHERAKALVGQFDDGAVFVNELVKSDPRLPFGGTKDSGYGRELSSDGILEFVNRKTVYFA
jgi:succinate-semialdehyde dehydrogenase/glutarate-semialdehyde dehydrogenase